MPWFHGNLLRRRVLQYARRIVIASVVYYSYPAKYGWHRFVHGATYRNRSFQYMNLRRPEGVPDIPGL